jgi:acyl carrier protein
MSTDLRDRVHRILMERLGLEVARLSPGDRLRDLGMDSLDAVEFAIAAEKELGATITEQQMMGVQTVGELVALVERLCAAAA